jgi:Plasmid pRiA4b ORF-3-like protein
MWFMPVTKATPTICQLKITLLEIEPPISRRIQVPSTIPLNRLHDVFQVVMGWTDSHLHQFEKDRKYWGVPETDEFGDLALIDEKKVPVREILKTEGDSVVYVYDFGDDWRHEVVLEKILPAKEGATKPVCLAGERRCPPEDVGGPHGYTEFLEVIFQPGHEEFEHFRGWSGGKFHAEDFDLKAVNVVLERMRWPVKHGRQK